MGVEVPLDQLQVGDLVFPGHLGHMGIYVGNNSFVHAPSSGDVVKVTSLNDYQIDRNWMLCWVELDWTFAGTRRQRPTIAEKCR